MNINNIIKLIKAYFYENWQNDVIYNFLVIMAVALFSMLMSPFDVGVVFFASFFLIIYYPCRLFSKLHKPSSRMHYLLLPATNGEKLVTGMFLANVYYVLGIVLSLTIGLLLGYGILYLVKPEIFGFHEMCLGRFFKDYILAYGKNALLVYASISIMFFAAIYFKKSPFWKLLLTGFIVSMVFGAIMFGVEWLNVVTTVPAEIRNGNYYKTEHYICTSDKWFSYVVSCVSIVYFYAMSFLRMKETEA